MMYDGQWQVYCGCFLFLFGTTRVTTITQMIRTFLSPLISAPVPNPNVNPKVNVKSVIPHEECRLGAHLPSLGRKLGVDKQLKSVTHGQCDARPTVTFPAAGITAQ